jgi:hypothetical protein
MRRGERERQKNLRNKFIMPFKSNLSEILFVNSPTLRFA